jgi:hypothetical protein
MPAWRTRVNWLASASIEVPDIPEGHDERDHGRHRLGSGTRFLGYLAVAPWTVAENEREKKRYSNSLFTARPKRDQSTGRKIWQDHQTFLHEAPAAWRWKGEKRLETRSDDVEDMDDGYYDMYKIVKALRDVRFDGIVILDHSPRLVGGNYAQTAYGFAYMRALLNRANAEVKAQFDDALPCVHAISPLYSIQSNRHMPDTKGIEHDHWDRSRLLLLVLDHQLNIALALGVAIRILAGWAAPLVALVVSNLAGAIRLAQHWRDLDL